MKVFALLKNPIIKTAGVIIVIYFAFFSDKKNPNGLAQRLSGKNIKSDLSEISRKSQFILTNVGVAKEVAKKNEDYYSIINQQIDLLDYTDIIIGEGVDAISCFDKARFFYKIFDFFNKEIEFSQADNVTIDNLNSFVLEKKLIGMKKNGVRQVIIPPSFNTLDPKLKNLLLQNPQGLKYEITVVEIEKNLNKRTCDE